jgi:hypothetical protein
VSPLEILCKRRPWGSPRWLSAGATIAASLKSGNVDIEDFPKVEKALGFSYGISSNVLVPSSFRDLFVFDFLRSF